MAHPRDTRNESLQCIACAIRQQKRTPIDGGDILIFLSNIADQRSLKGTELTDYNNVKNAVQIDSQLYSTGYQWGFQRWYEQDTIEEQYETMGEINVYEDDLDVKISVRGSQLQQWKESCAAIANRLATSSYLKGNDYIFYHADQIDIKSKAVEILKEVKDSAPGGTTFKRAIEFAAKGTGDKWNPADMFAVKRSSASDIETKVRNENWGNSTNDMREINKNLKEFKKKFRTGSPQSKTALSLHEGMVSIYTYNKYIDNLFVDGTCVPISLKKTSVRYPPLKLYRHKDDYSVKQAMLLKITIDKVDYKPTAQKAIVEFSVGKQSGWSLEIRGFESSSSGAISDVQLQLQKGKEASHGKITLPLYSFLTEASGGMRAVQLQRRIKRIIFGSDINLMGKESHVFTSNQVFDDYAKKKPIFDTVNGGERSNSPRFNRFRLVQDHKMWARYVHWLTRGSVPNANGVTNNDIIKTYEAKLGTSKNPSDSKWIAAAKYLKHKVQSAEAAFVVDISKPGLSRVIRENILKGAYTYGVSKGMTIFGEDNITEYVSSSTFLKVGG